MADTSKITPNDVNGPTEYAGNVAPKRADASTIDYYGDNPRGNRVDSGRIPKTLDSVSTNGSAAKPGGTPSGSSY